MLQMSTPYVAGFFRDLFKSGDFMPHGHCYFWKPDVLWTNIIGDAITTLAYLSIPFLLLYFIRKRKDLVYPWVFWLFALFILSCGTTHVLDIITIWVPIYRFQGVVKILTGIFSIATAGALLYIMPDLLQIPSTNELEQANQLLKTEVEEHLETELELQQKQKQLNEAQHLANMGSWEWDLKTDKVICSDGLYSMYETPSTGGIQTVDDLISYIHPDDKEMAMTILKQVMSEKTEYEVFYRIVTPLGTIKSIHGRRTVDINKEGEVVRIVAISQDVTQNMAQEQELRDKTVQLERTVNHLRKFAYATSHDLKEPLRGMIGYSQMIQTKYKQELNDEILEKLDLIAEEGKRLVSMVESVMEFSRSDLDEKKIEETDMQEIAKEIEKILGFTLAQKNAKLVYANLPKVKADKDQMLVLLQNLLSNAIKFNNSLEPKVTVDVLDDDKKYWHFVVSDNGIGIDMKYNQKIFEMFQRLNHRSEFQGSGIGLAICKNVVENHGGEIWVESKEGEGSQFHFTLPKA